RMKLLQAVLVGVGPFEKLVLPFAEETGEARALTVIHGAAGVGKSSVLAALASTRPGHCVVQPTRWEPRESAPQPFAACDWALGQDEPLRPHALSVVSPNARLSVNDEQEALRRREQQLFDRLASEGGFAFLSIPSTRWFSRQPIAFSAPARTVARYDVRASAAADEATRSDLTRETKQALAYAAISCALSGRSDAPAHGERCFELLGAAMQSTLHTLLSLVGCSYRGLDPYSFEPMFSVRGSERELPFDALPTRARHLVAFAALSVRTLWAAYPEHDPRESEGLIAIDDVDLHQDAQVQQQLIPAFREALPGVQWILTTASSVLASSVDPRAVLALRPVPAGAGPADAVRVFAGDQARTH
ncbi:MAG TPA: hypothetical protein VJV79_20680, partial [Polyangiaceae bacterium]|nr:hypothetical protein [Polyangiaceae bacterium]